MVQLACEFVLEWDMWYSWLDVMKFQLFEWFSSEEDFCNKDSHMIPQSVNGEFPE